MIIIFIHMRTHMSERSTQKTEGLMMKITPLSVTG
jgi:hypothetical protein